MTIHFPAPRLSSPIPPWLWLPLIGGGLALIFALDTQTTLGFAHGTLYTLLVLMSACSYRSRWVLTTVGLSIGLTALGFWFSPPAPAEFPLSYILMNRLLSILTILSTGGLLLWGLSIIQQLGQSQAHLNQTYQTLQEHQRLLEIASKLGRLGGWFIDLARNTVTWSEAVAQIHGTDLDFSPTIEQGINFYAPEYRDRVTQIFTACAQQGTPYDEELQLITTQGQRVWVRAIGQPVRQDDGTIIGIEGAFQDITAYKQLEQATRRLADRLNTTLESITDALLILDTQWRFTFINSQGERLLQRQRQDLLGQNIWDEFPEAIDGPFYQAYHQAVATGQTVHLRSFYPPLNCWFEGQVYPSSEGLAVYFRDVTDHIALEERLRQSQRLEAIGQLTGGVAHDFNNLLTVILGNAELLMEIVPDPAVLPLAQMIETAAQRGAELTQRLLAFARRQALAPQSIEVNQLLRQMDGLLRRSLGDHIEVELVCAPNLQPAWVDQAQMENALLNLCLNARDAMDSGGKLTLETANVYLDQTYADQNIEVQPGEYVMVAVSDTGTGIAPEHLDRVFEPFFTTKAKGKGTGLGLSMVYGFIKQSEGHIKIYSELGEGSTVRMYLPRSIEDASPAPPPQTQVAVQGGTEQILLVEDDELVRRYAQEQLLELGYQVTAADNGPAALAILQQWRDQREAADLLLTDVVMPGGLNGRQLAEAAQALQPGLKVLYTSGYTENAIIHHRRLDPDVHLLTKPYRREDLAHKIREVLDA